MKIIGGIFSSDVDHENLINCFIFSSFITLNQCQFELNDRVKFAIYLSMKRGRKKRMR